MKGRYAKRNAITNEVTTISLTYCLFGLTHLTDYDSRKNVSFVYTGIGSANFLG